MLFGLRLRLRTKMSFISTNRRAYHDHSALFPNPWGILAVRQATNALRESSTKTQPIGNPDTGTGLYHVKIAGVPNDFINSVKLSLERSYAVARVDRLDIYIVWMATRQG